MSALVSWVPSPADEWEGAFSALERALEGQRICLLTGAGCSTESGIPDYRGEGTARRARNPIQFREFLGSPEGRQRYWARATLGWPRFLEAQPGRAHHAAAALEAAGIVTGVITQNVDRLHARAGSSRVVELHGALAEVVCLDCGLIEVRDQLQKRLLDANPGWLSREAVLAPDGDSELAAEAVREFRVLDCTACAGVLKPRVVFFGEGVPAPTVASAFAVLEDSDCLLVVGSSLAVFSGYRFVRRALEQAKPIHVVNIGPTRADSVARQRVSGRAGEVLGRLAKRWAGV